MTAEIVDFPAKTNRVPGNGAREALIEIETGGRCDIDLCWADWLLVGLWLRGFKVVPLDGSEPAA